ncbi:MAG: hypothetical protein AB1751_04735 [Acidobacteriota bacterium]
MYYRFPHLAVLVIAVALVAASGLGEFSVRTMWREGFGTSSPLPVLWSARIFPLIYLGTFFFAFFVILLALRVPLRAASAELACVAMGFLCGAILTVAFTLLVSATAYRWSWLLLVSGMLVGVLSGVASLREVTGFGVFRVGLVLLLALTAASLALILVAMPASLR